MGPEFFIPESTMLWLAEQVKIAVMDARDVKGDPSDPPIRVETIAPYAAAQAAVEFMAMFTLTKQALIMVAKKRQAVTEIEITSGMIDAGEAVLNCACDHAEIPPLWSVISSAKDVYTAMETARRAQANAGRARHAATRARGADSRDER